MTDAHEHIDAEAEALIGEIAEEFTQQMVLGNQPRIESYIERCGPYADVLREVLPALQAIHPHTVSSDSSSSATRFSAEREPEGGLLGDFKILREIGRGGMGVVYECEQISLQRRVALKVLPMASVLDDRRLKRFRNEAMAAAQLDHPHIVDVLGVGSDRGVHYYAMRYIEGQTLADYIQSLTAERDNLRYKSTESISLKDFADEKKAAETQPIAGLSTDGPSTGDDRYRRLAEMFGHIASALEHAHQHGVIHRDVKPSNLIVDAGGKAWVCDFGLAQMENGTAGLTRTGDLVGTLRFLSPEQVSAKHLIVDGRIDVYALGATLYETLTLRPAFEANSKAELLRQIATVEPRPPRKIDARIPAELETIVLKAMAKNPHERYPSAGEFADDLQRFVSDKPIRARRPSLAQCLSRWARHHRMLVRTAITIAVLAGIGFGIASIAIDSARRDAVDARKRAEAEAERANRERLIAERWRKREGENFQRAMRAVDLMLTRVAQHRLANAPSMVDVRRELLEEALTIYRQFLSQRADDTTVTLKTVQAHIRVGEIQLMLGRWGDSRKAYRESLRLANKGRSPEGTDKGEYDVQRAIAYHNLGMIAFNRGESREAEKNYRMSLAIADALPAKKRRTPKVRAVRPASHNNLGNVLYGRGDHDAAAKHYRTAIREFRELVRDHPKAPEHRGGLATIYCSQARYSLTAGRMIDCEKYFTKAAVLQRKLVAEFPEAPGYRRELARTLGSLGDVQWRVGKFKASHQSFRDAVTMQKKLARPYSKVPDFKREVSRVHNAYSFLLKRLGQTAEAIRHSRTALTIRLQLAKDFPKVPRYRLTAARSRRHLAMLLAPSDVVEACKRLTESIVVLAKLGKTYPNVPNYSAELAESYFELGKLHYKQRQLETSEKNLRTSVGLLRKLVSDSRAFPRYRTLLVKARWHVAMILADRRQTVAAAELFAINTEEMRKLVAEFPETRAHRRDLAGCLQNLGLLRMRLRQFDAAESAFLENLSIYTKLMNSQTSASRYRGKYRRTVLMWGGLLHATRHKATNAVECLALSAAAWKVGRLSVSRRWFDRAAEMTSTDTAIYKLLLRETALLTGFQTGISKTPVVAPKPHSNRQR